eukprot:scaffold9933_cov125-Isochrysis_galbana.AAC.3
MTRMHLSSRFSDVGTLLFSVFCYIQSPDVPCRCVLRPTPPAVVLAHTTPTTSSNRPSNMYETPYSPQPPIPRFVIVTQRAEGRRSGSVKRGAYAQPFTV